MLTLLFPILKSHEANVLGFVRYELGEGIEKEAVDFASEVPAQIQATNFT